MIRERIMQSDLYFVFDYFDQFILKESTQKKHLIMKLEDFEEVFTDLFLSS